jgi:hypothetical protein
VFGQLDRLVAARVLFDLLFPVFFFPFFPLFLFSSSYTKLLRPETACGEQTSFPQAGGQSEPNQI